MNGKILGMMGGWWKEMRVMDWHGFGLVGASRQRRRNSKFDFV